MKIILVILINGSLHGVSSNFSNIEACESAKLLMETEMKKIEYPYIQKTDDIKLECRVIFDENGVRL